MRALLAMSAPSLAAGAHTVGSTPGHVLLAPQLDAADNGTITDTETQPMNSPRCQFSVCTISGACVWRYEGSQDLCIEQLIQYFEEGFIGDVPRARSCAEGYWLERYRLFWGAVELLAGRHLSDYEHLPRSATFT